MKKAPEAKGNYVFVVFIVLVLLVLTIWLNFQQILAYFFEDYPSKLNKRGQFGDAFGAVNALFSGLAFVGVGVTLWLQRIQLLEQRQSAKDQNEQLDRERFENTFFQMLTLHHEIVAAIWPNEEDSGRLAFSTVNSQIKNSYASRTHNRRQGIPEEKSPIEIARESYAHVYNNLYQNILGHYFRNLYRIFKYVHETNLIEDKQFYTDIVRAQLSNNELRVLFYNCGFFSAGEKFKELVEKYELLDNFHASNMLNGRDMDDVEILLRVYTPKAFGGKYPEIIEKRS